MHVSATITNILIILAVPALLVGCSRSDAHDQAGAAPPDVVSEHDDDDHILIRGGAVDWQPGPGSLEEGAEFAVLEGDPSAEGFFVLRIKMPDGFHISPHWHPRFERVTVISGTFLLGSGEVMNAGNVESLTPGSYTSMPPGMRHYALAEGETVIQLATTGPWEINYVNEEDDPRLRDAAR